MATLVENPTIFLPSHLNNHNFSTSSNREIAQISGVQVENGQRYYLVYWKNGKTKFSWEPEENLDFAESSVNFFITNLISNFVTENSRLSKKYPPRKKPSTSQKPSEKSNNWSPRIIQMSTRSRTATAEIVEGYELHEIKMEEDVEVGMSVNIPENDILPSATAMTTVGNSITDSLLNSISSIASGQFPKTISAPGSEIDHSNNMSDTPGPSSIQNFTIKQEFPEMSEFDDGTNAQIIANHSMDLGVDNSPDEYQPQNEMLNFSLPTQSAKNQKLKSQAGQATSTDYGYAHFTSSKGGKHASIVYRSRQNPNKVVRYCFKSKSSQPNGPVVYICLGCKKLKMRNRELPPIPRMPILDGKFLADPENTPERGHYCLSYSIDDL